MSTIALAKEFYRKGQARTPNFLHVHLCLDNIVKVDGAVKGDLRLLHVICDARGGVTEMAENLPLPQELDDSILAIVEITGVVDMTINVDVSHRDPERC
ncbi:hypothetical protein A6U98_31745 [Rhizobium sp. WYCCWR10014]|nr:hypothetical protein A6U98_31745 [Rhizobium sp. WYCCWR10014]